MAHPLTLLALMAMTGCSLTIVNIFLQDDQPLPDEDMVDGPPAHEDSRIHSEPEDSDGEVMQEQTRTGEEDEKEDEDGEDLLENMEGCGCSPRFLMLAAPPEALRSFLYNKMCPG